MRLPKIIALTGNMGVGKSEAIKFFTQTLTEQGFNVKLVKFADPLYDIQKFIYDRIHKEVPVPKDRFLLQFIGTEWGRSTQGENIWVDLWEMEVRHLNMFKGENLVIVCDDCRFDNEASKVKKLGGKIVKISSSKNSERIDTSRINHASEKGLSKEYFDYMIDNNGTLAEYYDKLSFLLKQEGF